MPSINHLFSSFLSLSQIPFLNSPSSSSEGGITCPPTAFYPSFIDTKAPTCPVDSPLSCHNSTTAPDSCCFIHPGGQLLSTQFWDTSPAVGPDDSWTLHGLWPDLCDGTYPTYCTAAPTYHNITGILSSSNNPTANALLEYMSTYWLPNRGSADHFWEHEWNKHGTCVNTLAPPCYAESYSAGDEVVDFFARAVEVFKSLNTYEALKKAGIEPSWYKTWTRDEVEGALKEVTGQDVVVRCRGGELQEAWYSFNVQGSLQTGEFRATAPVGKSGRGTCPERGIRYVPKGRRYES